MRIMVQTLCTGVSDEHICYILSSYSVSKLRYVSFTLNIKNVPFKSLNHSSMTILINFANKYWMNVCSKFHLPTVF